jgi:excisionase family DNA binding protein
VQVAPAPTDIPLAYRPNAAAKILGISRSRLYELLAAGAIRAHKQGSITLVPRAELERYLAELPTWGDSDGDTERGSGPPDDTIPTAVPGHVDNRVITLDGPGADDDGT